MQKHSGQRQMEDGRKMGGKREWSEGSILNFFFDNIVGEFFPFRDYEVTLIPSRVVA